MIILNFNNNPKTSAFGRLCRFIIILLTIFFVNSTGKSLPRPKAKTIRQTANIKTMNQTGKKIVAPGNWGGAGINLTVEKDGAKIEYDCAEAEIGEKLATDKRGNFNVEGSYLRHYPGAIRTKLLPKSQPAKFEGKISGETMMLKVTLTESGEEIGNYTLERGKTAKIHRCL